MAGGEVKGGFNRSIFFRQGAEEGEETARRGGSASWGRTHFCFCKIGHAPVRDAQQRVLIRTGGITNFNTNVRKTLYVFGQ